MKTMIQPNPDKLPNWWVPKLYEGLAPPASNYDEIMEWCRENCREPFYTYPSWIKKKGAQFEDDEEARSFSTWARLRYE